MKCSTVAIRHWRLCYKCSVFAMQHRRLYKVFSGCDTILALMLSVEWLGYNAGNCVLIYLTGMPSFYNNELRTGLYEYLTSFMRT